MSKSQRDKQLYMYLKAKGEQIFSLKEQLSICNVNFF